MAKKMQAAYVKVPFQFEVREVPIPEVREGWVLVKVEACGVCGTDLHYANVLAEDWQPFGHEVAGVVVEVGPGVYTVKEGDKVALESASFCGHCANCRNGRVDLCNKAPNFWSNESLGFAEYILAPKECLVPFDGLSFEVASLAEPLGVALDVVYTADIALGNEVLVLGLGAIALMAIPLVRMEGASRIYGANRSGGRRMDVARRFGADEVFSTTETPLDQYPFRKGLDRAVVAAAPATLPEVMPLMNFGGIIAYIGIEYGPRATISFDANDFHFNKLQLRASHASPALYFPTCLQLLKDGHVDGEAVVSHVRPLAQIAETMEMIRDCREDVLKVVITP
ncbi:MAG: alcohol dehydrogenase catalytic domain-containing protein [Anaerolineae bacterium]|nr:alcohol dehydrogenase catalytic domain-containing protein [Anaerolineae bacterium]